MFIVLGYHNVGGCRLVDDRQKSPVNKSLDLVSYHGMTLKVRQKRERGRGGISYIESKGGFLSESANRFSYLPKNIPNFYLELS